MHVPAGPLFLDLADVRAADPDLAGTFAAPLARAAQGGAPVPETTVVTAEACRRLAEIDDPRAEYHTPGDPAAPRQDPAVRALALAWHVAGSAGALPVVVHASPAGPYEHPALWQRAMTVGSWRRLLEVAAEVGAGRADGEPDGPGGPDGGPHPGVDAGLEAGERARPDRRVAGPAALVVQRAVAITGSGRAWPGEPVLPGGRLDRGQAQRLTHMVAALGTAVRWGLDTVGNLWILACLGARVGAAPSAPACGAVA
jgi:hypothetical protein